MSCEGTESLSLFNYNFIRLSQLEKGVTTEDEKRMK